MTGVPPGGPVEPLERIRDWTVADGIAAAVGTDRSPELLLSNIVSPVVLLERRPPLAGSGYFPGTIGINVAGVALNTTHAGIFVQGRVGAMARINWARITNTTGATLSYNLIRLDVVTGFTAVAAIPAYIGAGTPETGFVFSLSRSNTVAQQGVTMASFRVPNNTHLEIQGPWLMNDGALLIAPTTVDQDIRISMGYEAWPAVRSQPIGG